VRKAKNEAQLKQIKRKITALTANGWANRGRGGGIASHPEIETGEHYAII